MPAPINPEGVSTSRKNLVPDKMEADPAFRFFRLIKEVSANGICHHLFQFFPGVRLGEDGFGEAFGNKTAV